jgi:hypothetical protein
VLVLELVLVLVVVLVVLVLVLVLVVLVLVVVGWLLCKGVEFNIQFQLEFYVSMDPTMEAASLSTLPSSSSCVRSEPPLSPTVGSPHTHLPCRVVAKKSPQPQQCAPPARRGRAHQTPTTQM